MPNGGKSTCGGQGTVKWRMSKGIGVLKEVMNKLHHVCANEKYDIEENGDLSLHRTGTYAEKRSHQVKNPYVQEVQNYMPRDREEKNLADTKIVLANTWTTDNEWIGEIMMKKKVDEIRLWVQNPNGIRAKDDFRLFRSVLDEVNDHRIDFLAMPESTLNNSNHFVRDRLSTVVDYQHPNAKMCITNTSGYCQDTCYQPGGVVSIAMGKLAGRYAGSGSDVLGRYSWMKFCGKLRTVKIYTFYRVSQHSGNNIGDTTAYVQQYNKLNARKCTEKQQVKVKEINPRQHVIESLLRDIEKDIKEKHLIIVMGDLNENVKTAKFSESLEKMGILNAMSQINEENKYRSYDRGKNIIDGAWMSCTLLPHITNRGIAPFYTIFESDHRGMYIDLNLKHILDSPPIEFQQLHFRRLQSSIPRRTKAYASIVQRRWKQQKVHEKIHHIVTNQSSMNMEEVALFLNKVDTQIGEILTHAEKKCTNVSSGATHEWSPKLGGALRKERESRKRLRKLRRCSLIDNQREIQVAIQEEIKVLSEIRQEVRNIKTHDKEFRKAHLDELIEEKIKKNPTSTYAEELKRLSHIEIQRKEARHIRSTSGVKKKQGVLSILIPDQSEYSEPLQKSTFKSMDTIWERLRGKNGKDVKKWIEIDERKEVERLTLECMKKHFSQAEGTPLTSNYWTAQLTDDEFIQNIRNENYECLHRENEAICAYFQAMSQNNKSESLPKFEYTFESWKRHIQNVKERTTTSPSGRHYGHFKALLDKLPEVFRDLYEINRIALQRGIILERWKVTVTVLIPKEEGTPKIHRLRPLHIVEPEVNALAKALWASKLMRLAETTNNMSNDQYGGRKHRQAQSAVLNKILYYDINRMQMKEAQYDDIDMKSNYDRELVRLVSAEARIKLGLHKCDANFMIDFVESQKFHVKTAFGISEDNYSYNERHRLYGLGQGIAWSGPGWLLSSDTIAKCKDKTCTGMVYRSPISDLKVEKKQDMFVDDTGCGCNEGNGDTRDIMEQAQENCQHHSNYVETTGGMIAADKSHFYHIPWEFVNGFQRAKLDVENTSKIVLNQCDGVTRPFRKMSASEEHKTLGCWVNPLGKQEKAYQQIETFARNWVNRMSHSNLPAHLIRKSYESELKSQIRYRMPIYMFTKTQCDDIMKIINPTVLHSHFVNKNYSRTLLQADDQYAGLNVTHIYDLMGMEKTKFLFMHLRRQDTTAKLLQIAMQSLQLECGSEKLFFNIDYSQYSPLVTPTWCTNLWEYYDARAIYMDLDLEIVAKKQRKNDNFIMDILVQQGTFTDEELVGINKVRQHLGLLMLSDVADLRGKRLLQIIKEGENKRGSKYKFAPQMPKKIWYKWWKNKACPILERELQRQPLGKWTNASHQEWKWEYAEVNKEYLKNGKSLYCKEGNEYVRCDLDEAKEVNFTHYVDINTDRKGNPYVITTMSKESFIEWEIENVNSNGKNNINAYDCYMKDWGKIEYLVGNSILKKHLEKGECLIATDGSNKYDEGAQAWLVANNDGKVLVRGRGRVPYQKSDASSLRPELAALLAVTTFLNHYVIKHQVQMNNTIKLNIYTDSKNAITDLESGLYPSTKNALENNMDLKLEIKKILRKSLLKFCLIHVLAHQNEKRPYEDLPLQAQLNCQVDAYAGGVYEDVKCGEVKEHVEFYRAQICSLKLPFIRPTTNIMGQLIAFANGHASEAQLARYWGVKNEWMCNIEWRGFKTALRRMRNDKKGNMCKLVHKQLPTMSILTRNGMGMTTKCPLCLTEDEDWSHVFKCKSNVARVERVIQLANLKKGLLKINTCPVLMRRILATITQSVNNYKVTVPMSTIGDLQIINEAIHDQHNLGIENMFAGVVSHKFGDIQAKYYKNLQQNKQRYSKNEWNATFIKLLLTFGTAIWQHRCEYLHNESMLSNEKQIRALTWKMRTNLCENPWKLRPEDKHLMRRKKDFFVKSAVRNLNGWLERVLLSMKLREDHDLATRQDIRKWLLMPGEGNMKRVQYPTPVIKKKYRQPKLTDAWRLGDIRLENSGTPVQSIRNEAPLPENINKQGREELREHIQNEIGSNEMILEVQETKQLDQEVGSDKSCPKQHWFQKILGTWKGDGDHIINDMEEIVFGEDMGNRELCEQALTGEHRDEVIELGKQNESTGSGEEKYESERWKIQIANAKVTPCVRERMEGNGKILKQSHNDLIGRKNEKKNLKITMKKMGGDIRTWLT